MERKHYSSLFSIEDRFKRTSIEYSTSFGRIDFGRIESNLREQIVLETVDMRYEEALLDATFMNLQCISSCVIDKSGAKLVDILSAAVELLITRLYLREKLLNLAVSGDCKDVSFQELFVVRDCMAPVMERYHQEQASLGKAFLEYASMRPGVLEQTCKCIGVLGELRENLAVVERTVSSNLKSESDRLSLSSLRPGRVQTAMYVQEVIGLQVSQLKYRA